ncbi:MAG: hypothetical protein HQK60_13560 [Deltaproteobacteria bacterium]|nr:hypothetical protein [Deltaproteobacteria bacterium]
MKEDNKKKWMSSLFPEHFPILTNNKELDSFKKDHPEYDPYYVRSGVTYIV